MIVSLSLKLDSFSGGFNGHVEDSYSLVFARHTFISDLFITET